MGLVMQPLSCTGLGSFRSAFLMMQEIASKQGFGMRRKQWIASLPRANIPARELAAVRGAAQCVLLSLNRD